MKIDQFLIGMLIFSLFFVVGTLAFYRTSTDYGQSPDMSRFEDAHNENHTGNYSIIDNMYNDIAAPAERRLLGSDSTEVGGENEDPDVSLIGGAFRTVKLIRNSFSLFNEIVKSIVTGMGFPPIFISFIYAAFLLAIIFAIILLIWRLRA